MKTLNLQYILFDLIGTTIRDSQNGKSIILDSFYKAFHSNGFEISRERIKQERGKIKREAIKNILLDIDVKSELNEKIYLDFMTLLNDSVGSFEEINGASKLFKTLRNKGIKIGLGSGLPRGFMKRMIQRVGWEMGDFDYIASSEDLGKGRPNPIMILDSMEKLNIVDKSSVLKIGDTIVDIQEGKNAGVLTAGVLTGSMSRMQIEKANPDYFFSDINDLLDLELLNIKS